MKNKIKLFFGFRNTGKNKFYLRTLELYASRLLRSESVDELDLRFEQLQSLIDELCAIKYSDLNKS